MVFNLGLLKMYPTGNDDASSGVGIPLTYESTKNVLV